MKQNKLKGFKKHIGRAITNLVDMAEYAHEQNNEELQKKVKKTLDAIYQVDIYLHIQLTKNKPVLKTPDYIKQGLSQMQKQAIVQTLNKEK